MYECESAEKLDVAIWRKEYNHDYYKPSIVERIKLSKDGKNDTIFVRTSDKGMPHIITSKGSVKINKFYNTIEVYKKDPNSLGSIEIYKDKKILFENEFGKGTVYKDGNKYITMNSYLTGYETVQVWKNGEIVETYGNTSTMSDYNLDKFKHYKHIYDKIYKEAHQGF